jgi:hypothetical protein
MGLSSASFGGTLPFSGWLGHSPAGFALTGKRSSGQD